MYGSVCGSALSAYWTISPRPVFIWGAKWDDNPNVYTMGPCVSSDIWPKRHKQYKGETSVTANGVTRIVDINCAQGPMYGPADRTGSVCR